MKVRKAVFPVAGFGTRFLPATMAEGQSVYVPLGARHRLENPGALPMVLIEVQIGSYLSEDDITRYEDLYARK